MPASGNTNTKSEEGPKVLTSGIFEMYIFAADLNHATLLIHLQHWNVSLDRP